MSDTWNGIPVTVTDALPPGVLMMIISPSDRDRDDPEYPPYGLNAAMIVMDDSAAPADPS